MIRRGALMLAAVTIAAGFSAVSANAAGLGQARLDVAKSTSPVVSVTGSKVCLMHQCPGRSRIVCGCSKSTR